MKRISRSLILSLGVTVPVISSPALLLTSCSQVWGYNSPIQFGSALRSSSSNPFVNFNADADNILDANGNKIVNYLQSNYTIDSKNNAYYAYSQPVTKWTYTKDEAEAKGVDTQIMPLDEWEHKAGGWKTSSASEFSSNYSFTGKIYDKDKYQTVVNNENVIQAANIDFTGSIASTIAGFFTGALKYQASQVNPNDGGKNLNIAWGSAANFLADRYTTLSLNHGVKETEEAKKGSDADKLNNDFFEFAFAQANGHVSAKSKHGAFVRTTGVGFNFDKDYFPIPTYNFNAGEKVDIGLITKKLLMGSTAIADTKWCELGTAGQPVAYYSSKTDGNQTITLGYDETEKKDVTFKLQYTDYVFNAVPVLITVNDLTQRWVNPTIKSSIHVKDYYVDDKTTVNNIVGKFQNIGKFANHDGSATIREYTFTPSNTGGSTKIQVEVKPTKIGEVEKCYDTRIVADPDANKLAGNKFVALVTYAVREFDNNKFLIDSETSTATEYLNNLAAALSKVRKTTVTTDQAKAYLRSLNVSQLEGTTTIFPAYFMNIYNDLFVKSYTPAKGETIQPGYILNVTKITNHVNDLLGLFNRTSKEGYKASASDLSQDSKNLLTFLTFMFKNGSDTEIHFGDAMVRVESEYKW